MKVVLNYDPTTGHLTDKDGGYIYQLAGIKYEDFENKSGIEVNELIKLKEAGFTVEEITHLKDRSLI